MKRRKRRWLLISEQTRRWRTPWATRNGEPWTLAEDRRLLRLWKARRRMRVKAAIAVQVSRELQRTPASVSTRFFALQAGARLARRQRT